MCFRLIGSWVLVSGVSAVTSPTLTTTVNNVALMDMSRSVDAAIFGAYSEEDDKLEIHKVQVVHNLDAEENKLKVKTDLREANKFANDIALRANGTSKDALQLIEELRNIVPKLDDVILGNAETAQLMEKLYEDEQDGASGVTHDLRMAVLLAGKTAPGSEGKDIQTLVDKLQDASDTLRHVSESENLAVELENAALDIKSAMKRKQVSVDQLILRQLCSAKFWNFSLQVVDGHSRTAHSRKQVIKARKMVFEAEGQISAFRVIISNGGSITNFQTAAQTAIKKINVAAEIANNQNVALYTPGSKGSKDTQKLVDDLQSTSVVVRDSMSRAEAGSLDLVAQLAGAALEMKASMRLPLTGLALARMQMSQAEGQIANVHIAIADGRNVTEWGPALFDAGVKIVAASNFATKQNAPLFEVGTKGSRDISELMIKLKDVSDALSHVPDGYNFVAWLVKVTSASEQLTGPSLGPLAFARLQLSEAVGEIAAVRIAVRGGDSITDFQAATLDAVEKIHAVADFAKKQDKATFEFGSKGSQHIQELTDELKAATAALRLRVTDSASLSLVAKLDKVALDVHFLQKLTMNPLALARMKVSQAEGSMLDGVGSGEGNSVVDTRRSVDRSVASEVKQIEAAERLAVAVTETRVARSIGEGSIVAYSVGADQVGLVKSKESVLVCAFAAMSSLMTMAFFLGRRRLSRVPSTEAEELLPQGV